VCVFMSVRVCVKKDACVWCVHERFVYIYMYVWIVCVCECIYVYINITNRHGVWILKYMCVGRCMFACVSLIVCVCVCVCVFVFRTNLRKYRRIFNVFFFVCEHF
jgi:hypothetical protein